MSLHTQGPWKSEHKTDAYCKNRYIITGISRIDGRAAHVADDVIAHNVAVITAAPKMLAMLEKMHAAEMNPAVSAELGALIVEARVIAP